MGGQPAASKAGSPTPNGCSRARSRHHPCTATVAEPDLLSGPVNTAQAISRSPHERRRQRPWHPARRLVAGRDLSDADPARERRSREQSAHLTDGHDVGPAGGSGSFRGSRCPPSSSGSRITRLVDRLPRWCEIWPWRNTQSRPFLREISNRNAQLRMCTRLGGGAA